MRGRRRALGSRAFRWFWGRDVREDVDDEVRFHLDMRERELIAAGMDPDAARARARALFGDVDRVRDQCHRLGERRALVRRIGDWIGGVARDARYAVRALARDPAFALPAALLLALGIGATSTLFAVIDAVVLRPLHGVRDVDQVVELSTQSVSYPTYRDLRDGVPALAGVAAFSTRTVALGDAGRSVLTSAVVVSGNFFSVLGTSAHRGRLLEPADDDAAAAPVAVVSEAYFRRFLAADPSAVGTTLLVDGRSVTIVGVAPPGFGGARLGVPDVWLPIHAWPRIAPPAFTTVGIDQRNWSWLHVIGRLAPGVTRARAEAAVNVAAAAMRAAHPRAGRVDERLELAPVTATALGLGRDSVVGFLGLLAAVVGLVLAITCANVANLLLCRAARRRREIAVRLAIGAGRGRLVRQLVTESLVLALSACALGLGLALVAVHVLDGTALPGQLESLALRPDGRVLAVTIVVSLATGVAFGLVPALQATRVDLVPGLKSGGGGGDGRSRLRGALLVGQVALSLVLLVGAGLFARALQRALAIDPGFRPDGVALIHANPGLVRYDAPRAVAFFTEAARRVRSLPGVVDASWASSVPLTDDENIESADIDGYTRRPDETVEVEVNLAGAGLHDTLGIQLARGRGFDGGDVAGAEPVAIVNETLVARYVPDGNPLGKRVKLAPGLAAVIVGVARDIKAHGLREDAAPYVYFPLAQQLHAHPFLTDMTLFVRMRVPPETILPALERELRAAGPDVPVYWPGTLPEVVDALLLPQRLGVGLLGLFSLLAVCLAALGVFGVVAYGVAQRVREIGIRMALGATSADVVRLVLRHSLAQVAAGVAIGVVLAAACARATETFLYGVKSTDLPTYALTSVVLLAVAFVAAYLPARGAARTSPAITLRAE